MKKNLVPLSARLNSTDISAVAGVAQAMLFERKMAQAAESPLSYVQRGRRNSGLSSLLAAENLLRRAVARVETWEAAVRARVETLAVLPLYDKAGILPPSVVRVAALDSSLHLVNLAGTIELPSGCLVNSVRLTLEFDPRQGNRPRPQVFSLFPRRQSRFAAPTDLRFGLLPNLTFWTPFLPERLSRRTPSDGPRPVPKLVFGPRTCSFRRVGSAGLGVGTSRLDLYFFRAQDSGSGSFDTWFVLRVPRRAGSVRVRAFLGADVRLPRELAPILGSNRTLRDRRDWEWPLPAPGRLPARRD